MVMRGSVAKSNGSAGKRDRARRGIDHAMQRVADHRGVLVQLLFHEVAEIALADRRTGQPRQLHFALHLGAVMSKNRAPLRSTTVQSPSLR